MLKISKLILRGLKNIFLSVSYRISKKLDFPACITPSIFYKQNIDFDLLLEKQQVYLLRRSDSSHEDTFNSIGNLREEHFIIEPKRIPYLSLNLLGRYFESKYSNFKIINKGAESWTEKTPIFIIDYLNDYQKLQDFCNIYFDANKLHDQNMPCAVPSNIKGLHAEVEKYFTKMNMPPNNDKKEFEFTYTTKIKHDPINLNYWHVEYLILDFKKHPIPRNRFPVNVENLCKKIYTDILVINSYDHAKEAPLIGKKYFHRLLSN